MDERGGGGQEGRKGGRRQIGVRICGICVKRIGVCEQKRKSIARGKRERGCDRLG